MKRIGKMVVTVSAIAAFFAAIYSYASSDKSEMNATDKDGHVLVSLWKAYEKESSSDSPQKAEQILDEIVSKAKKEGYAWDFYDGLRKWHETVISRDWKRRSEARLRLKEESADFNKPVVLYRLAKDRLTGERIDIPWYRTYVSGRRQDLMQGRNEYIHSSDENLGESRVPAFVVDCISNDYEYVLWSLTLSGASFYSGIPREVSERAEADLADYLGGAYPSGAYLEFIDILTDDYGNCDAEAAAEEAGIVCGGGSGMKEDALRAFEEKYSGKAIALFAAQERLCSRKKIIDEDISKQKPVSSDDCRKLREDCAEFEKLRKSFTGREAEIAKCCKNVAELIDLLDSKRISVSMNDDGALITLINLGGVSVELRDDSHSAQVVDNAVIENDVRNYYVPDTLRYSFPENLGDGNYYIDCREGKERETVSFYKYSLSAAIRTNASGTGIYLSDYLTGRPVEKADLEFRYKGRPVKSVEDFVFSGFSSIQEILTELIRNHSGALSLICSLTDEKGIYRRSEEIYLYNDVPSARESSYNGCLIFKDRSAFTPGDTVKFKAVLCSVKGSSCSTVSAGRPLKAVLLAADGQEVSSLDLKTGEFGSAAGEFAIPEGLRGGHFKISILDGEKICGQSTLVVDEFVLPTFNLEFEKDSVLHYNGEKATVRGHIESYSGHSLSGAKLSYMVRPGRMAAEIAAAGEINPSPKGDFAFAFKIPEDSGCDMTWYVEVKAVDMTGETLEWSTSFRSEPSVYFDLSLKNRAQASVRYRDETGRFAEDSNIYALDGNIAEFKADVYAYTNAGYKALPTEVKYKVTSGGKEICGGTILYGKGLAVDLSGFPSGKYLLEAESEYVHPKGKVTTFRRKCSLLKTDREDTVLDADVDFFTKKYDGGNIAVQIGGTKGVEWVVAELYDDKARLLRSEILCINGVRGEKGSVKMLEYEFLEDYPEIVRLQLVSFKNGRANSASYDFVRQEPASSDFPIEFTSFVDKTQPREEYQFGIRTLPGVECAVSVFDASTERIAGNVWRTFSKPQTSPLYVHLRTYSGGVRGAYYVRGYSRNLSSGSVGSQMVMSKASTDMLESVGMIDVVEDASGTDENSEGMADVVIRDRFDNTLAFLPLLRSDDEGNVIFNVKTSDKLSTYCVQVFAHGKNMDSGVSRRSFTVSMPVKVNVLQPQFLYGGDLFRLKASVSNGSDTDVSGVLQLYVYDTEEYKTSAPVSEKSIPLSIKAGESASGEFEIAVPEKEDESVLGFKVVFHTEAGETAVSDGLFVSVPILAPVQTLVEAHSALLRPGMDRDSLKNALASEFTGTLGQTYGYKEISLIDMILEAIPDKVEPKSKDVLSMAEAYCVSLMSAVLSNSAASVKSDSDLLSRILACQNQDGGFAWFEGFRSSPVLTAVVLERFALLADFIKKNGSVSCESSEAVDLPANALAKAVGFLDERQLASEMPLWWGGLSIEQYLYVRSMYPEAAFSPSADKKNISAFRKQVKDYLQSSSGLKGYILGKARRAATALNFTDERASELASSFGLSRNKLMKRAAADMSSLFEYAVRHPSGGFYYPNAVMPFRGLLESEVYAHSLLCDLMSRYSEICTASAKRNASADAAQANDIAEGIRLWLMVQKETQKWESDPAYVNAINSVLNGSENVKKSVIMVLDKRYAKPFEQVSAAGNGFTIVRKYYRAIQADGTNGFGRNECEIDGIGKNEGGGAGIRLEELKDGDFLSVGDKVVAEYGVWSAENRSFVCLSAPRCAALRPVLQLSGISGGFSKEISTGVESDFVFSPRAYREVKSDRTYWYIDVAPEEDTVFSEEFYVTQSGVFTSPVVTIESLYSPHYRANDMFGGLVRVEQGSK